MKKFIVLVFLLSNNVAVADELSARQLYEFCASTDMVSKTACRFFILGAVLGVGLGDSAVMGPDRQFRERPKTHFCIPSGILDSQMVDIFQRTAAVLAATYPNDLNSPAVSIVDAAMSHAFPCGRNR